MEGKVFNLSVITAVFHARVPLESIIKEETKTHFLSYHTFFPINFGELFYISPF